MHDRGGPTGRALRLLGPGGEAVTGQFYVGSVTFVAGLASAAAAVPFGERTLRQHGNFIAPLMALTELRVMTGTAAVFALAASWPLPLGTVLRRAPG